MPDNNNRIFAVYYSATFSTKQVVKHIAGSFGTVTHEIDITVEGVEAGNQSGVNRLAGCRCACLRRKNPGSGCRKVECLEGKGYSGFDCMRIRKPRL